MKRKFCLWCALVLALVSLSLHAQSVFVLPASFGSSANVIAFTANPFAQSGTFTANTAASIVIASPDGTKYYIISNSGSNTLMTVDTAFSTVRSIASLGQGAAAAVLTPDGSKLLIAAGNLQIFNTSTDAPAVSGGVNVGGTPVDVAASIDSTRAYVLVNTGAAFQLAVVDLRTFQVVSTLPISGTATGVSVGPNGLVYVGTTNQLLEIDPNSYNVRQTISINGRPGKLTFTPDGKYGIAVNQNPITGSVIFFFDLVGRTLAGIVPTGSVPANTIFDRIVVVGNNRILAYSSGAQTLFDIAINPVAVTPFAYAPSGGVSGLAISNDIATQTRGAAQYLFFVSGGNLYRLDLNSNQLTGQLALTGTTGALSFAAAPVTSGTPATLITYGDNQTVPVSSTSAPLVIRVVDAQGRPLARVPVTFSTTAAGIGIQNASTTTNNEGLATTTITTPSTAGFVTIAATAGSLTTSFSVNVGGASPGAGTASGGLTIVNGQGAILIEQTSTFTSGSTMKVKLTDTAGNPIVGSAVTFTLTSGNGTITAASAGAIGSGLNSITINTDTSGIAAVDFLATSVPTFPGFAQSTVVASSSSGSSVTFYVTAVSGSNPPTIQLVTPALGDVLTGQAGQKITGAIKAQIVAGSGQPIPNVSLHIVDPTDPTVSPAANCAGGFPLSDVNGLVTCDLVLGGKVGTVQIGPNVGYVSTLRSITVKVTPGAPANVNIRQGNNQSGKPGDTLPFALVVQVTDAFGNVLQGTPVTWKVVTPGTVTLSNVISTTDAQGLASALAKLGNTSGQVQVQVTAGGVTQTFTLNVTVAIGGVQIVSGNSQVAAINAAFGSPIVVKVTDANGNPIQGTLVTFAVTGGSATLSNPSATTDASGNASTNVTAGGAAGAVTITATVGATSATFTLTVRPPGPSPNSVVLNAASFQQSVSPGAIVTIQGSGIAPGIQGVVAPNNVLGPLPTTLAGVSVTFNGTPAPIYSVSNVNGVEQVTVQVPFELAGSTSANVTINTPGGGSGTISNVQLKPFAPGVFETNAFGLAHQAVAIRPDGSFVSPANPARRGETIRIFATGLGQTTPVTATNFAGVPGQNVAAQLVVGLNNSGVPLISAQTVPGLVGVFVVALQVPSDTTPGPQQPVGLIAYDAAGNPFFAQGTFIPIQ